MRALVTLAVAFLCAVVAAITFAGLGALSPTATVTHWTVFLGAVVQMLTSAILIVFTLALLVPNQPNRRLGDELVNVFSATWIIFFGIWVALLRATPSLNHRSWGPAFLSLTIVTAQVFFPHGRLRLLLGEESYRSYLEQVQGFANRFLVLSAVVTTIIFLSALIKPRLSSGTCLVWLYLLVVFWSAGLLLLQVWIEGTRKRVRYNQFPNDFLTRS